jgi:hypothetical protein
VTPPDSGLFFGPQLQTDVPAEMSDQGDPWETEISDGGYISCEEESDTPPSESETDT